MWFILNMKSLVIPPLNIPKPVVVISGSRFVGSCDFLTLTVGSTEGNMGKPVDYEWSVHSETELLRGELLLTVNGTSTLNIGPSELRELNEDLLRIELFSRNWVCDSIL